MSMVGARRSHLPSVKRLICVSFLLLGLSGKAGATCWEEAGRLHGIDPVLLMAIAWQESRGKPNAVGPLLEDGNRALGLMQINSIHLPRLNRYGIDREDLFDACTSQKVGAWILSDCIRQFGKKWKAVGCYYAGARSRATKAQESYVHDVMRWYQGYRMKKAS